MLFFHFGQGFGVATDEANGPSLFQKTLCTGFTNAASCACYDDRFCHEI
jgi:hypothetical protein